MSTENMATVADEAAASTDVRQGYLSGPGFTDVPVRYSVVEGIALFDGCIDMGPVQEVERHAAMVDAQLAAAAQTITSPAQPTATGANEPVELAGIGLPPDSTFLWTNGVVPYVIDQGLPNQQRVLDAVAHFAQNSPIRLVPRGTQDNYVRFISNGNANFSSSPIGMRGGEQIIRISNGATAGTVIHECCHSLGILHEQSRCDRDSFVTINYQNVQAGFESNFDKFCAGFTDYFEYDFGSIMHYPATAFSTNGQPTIVPRVAGVTLGQRTGLSFGDRLTIAEMYRRFAGSGHHGVWRSGNAGYGLWVNATWEDFVAKWNEWGAQGLRLIDITVRQTSAGQRYSGVWTAGTGGYGLWANATWASFVAKWNEWGAQGLRLVDMHVLRVGDEFRYSGVWMPGTGGYGLWGNASWASFVAKWNEWGAQGLRLVDINAVRVGGQTLYSGVWLPGTGGYGLWGNATWDGLVTKWREWSGQGLRLVDVNAHVSDGQTRWAGVFLPGTDGYYLWGNAPWEGFRAKWQQLGAQGLRLVDYEFTAPQAAADPALDAAGLPVAVAEDEDEDGTGGGFVLGEGRIPRPAPSPEDAGAGEGMLVLDPASVTHEATEVPQGAGQGAVVLNGATPAAAGAAPDDGTGQGSLVTAEPAPGTSGDGVGHLVTSG